MGNFGENVLMGMLGALCEWGVFIDKLDTISDDEFVMYVNIPEKSYAYADNGIVDMSTPEKFMKNIKDKFLEGPFRGVNARLRYKIRPNSTWTKENGKEAFEYNRHRIVNKEFPVLPPNM